MNKADTDSANWPADNKGYLGYRFSKLTNINTGNVANLKKVCTYPLGLNGSFQNGPVVYDAMLYTTTAFSTIAIDAATCEKRWEHKLDFGHLGALMRRGRGRR